MPLIGLRRMDALVPRPPRRRSRRIRFAVLISLLAHGVIGVLLLLSIRHQQGAELLPPPSAVTMLFETGRKQGPTVPSPDLQATPSPPAAPAPSKPPTPPSPQRSPPQPLPPQPLPPLPTPPAPPAIEPPPPLPAAPPPPVAPPSPTPPLASPSPPTTSLPQPAPAPPAAEKPPPTAELAPIPPPAAPLPPVPLPSARPPPIPPPPVPPPSARPPPAQKPPARAASRPPTPQKPSDFPAPMNFSFGTPSLALNAPPRPRSPPHIPGTIDMSLGPAARGSADATPLSDRDADRQGADWRNALSRWVAEHAYYPMEARRDGDEGDSKVRVVADPSGRVKLVELVGKSGSMWLDLALLALFRDQTIPALPYGTKEPIDFNFTMHYVLIRPR